MKQRIFLITAILTLAAVGVLLWQAADRPLEKVGAVSIAASLSLPSASIWIAQARGLFEQAGVEVTLKECAFGKACIEAMHKGEAELTQAAEFKATQIAFEDKSLRILSTLAFAHLTKVLSLKEQGIAGPADLKGKRAGVIFGTVSEYFLARLLTLNGMKREDVAWVGLQPKEMAEVLVSGKADVVVVWSPYSQQIKAKLPGRISEIDAQPGQDYYYVLLGEQAWLAKNPKIAGRVMLALKWAEQWMAAHPDETRAFLAAKYGVSPEELNEDLRNTRFSISLPQTLLSAIEEESRWLAEQGTPGTSPANSLDLIAFDPLTAVAPEAVTMIRGTPQP